MNSPALTYDADVLEAMELAQNVYTDINKNGQPVGFKILKADAT